ncbi:MAG: matrixin family metalloprotease [Anaerolineae bacterium]|nr:matrixin family metalloprotease [Anaerolineae bacterium]
MDSKENIRKAYDLIKAGNKPSAVEILRPICKSEPANADAWWLLANALSEPRQIQMALQQLLQINPFHEQAQRKLERLIAEHGTQQLPPPLPASATIGRKQPPPRALLLLIIALGLISLIAAVFIWQGNSSSDASVAEIQVTLPTSIADLFTSTFTSTPSVTPSVTNTATPRATATPLPATWTPTDPPVSNSPLITNTPWIRPTNTLATANPSLFGETYWEGIGDGYTLETYTRSGGRHLRFYEFPVKVYIDGGDKEWRSAVHHAMGQIGQIIPIEMVDEEIDATLVIYILPPDDYEYWSGCPKTETLGCAVILDLGDLGGGDTYHRIYGQVYLSADSYNKAGTALHEMLHALGVMVHSPEPGDIMYPFITNQTTLSQRDLNTLRRLYANPSYAD